ncbi:hypothetical protein NDN08_000616 [Rhodosorus marinus]|uniref:Cytochrome b561 domain-containing protein n=1 Tax=Rhodosorus marinus TaxID=101924 RepID=A0AAV8USM6_9RHOD|nr:hypothetical protein NDN08_000616 [Rhodosorus marinus]
MVSSAIDCTVAFDGGEVEFDTCQSILGDAKLYYSFVGDEVDMAFQVNLDDGYFGFGFPQNAGQMTGPGSVAAIAYVSSGSEPFVGDYTLLSKSTAGVQVDGLQLWTMSDVSFADNLLSARFVRKQVIDGLRSVVPGTLQYMTASGSAPSSPSTLTRHTHRFYGSIQLLEGENGDVDTGDIFPELGSDRYVNVFTAHGALMVTAWIFLIPLGIIMARHFRQKTDHWFNIHRIVQGTAVIISLAAFILALVESIGGISSAHLVIGIIVTVFSLLSASAATFLRPVKDSRRRKQFNIVHRVAAAVMFALAVANCYIGRNLLNDVSINAYCSSFPSLKEAYSIPPLVLKPFLLLPFIQFTDTKAFLIVISVGLGVMVVAEIVTLVLIPRFDPAVEKADDAESNPSGHTKDAGE